MVLEPKKTLIELLPSRNFFFCQVVLIVLVKAFDFFGPVALIAMNDLLSLKLTKYDLFF